MIKKILAIGALMFAFSGTAQAAALDGWSGEASATGSNTTGNTETTDVGLAIKLAKEAGDWRHKFKAAADYGKVSGAKNKSRFALGYQIDRDINDRLYVFGNGDYYKDDFGAYEDGYYIGTGLGYKVILPDPVGWNLEGGVGYRSQSVRTIPSVTETGIAVRGFSDFDFKFNDNVSLYNDTEILWSEADTHIWNETGITAQLMGNLAARASFRIDNHSDVPAGFEKTDTITRVGVVYTIK